MAFAADITSAEAALGFEVGRHVLLGRIVFARIDHGLRAIKTIADDGLVRYEVCDDSGMVLYPAASSLSELGFRFGLYARRSG